MAAAISIPKNRRPLIHLVSLANEYTDTTRRPIFLSVVSTAVIPYTSISAVIIVFYTALSDRYDRRHHVILSVILNARKDRFELNKFQNESFHKLFVSVFDYICRTSITGNYGAALECWISKENFSENFYLLGYTASIRDTSFFKYVLPIRFRNTRWCSCIPCRY